MPKLIVTEPSLPTAEVPAVRLAVAPDGGKIKGTYVNTLGPKEENSPAIRLAHVPGAQGDNNLLGQRGVEALPDTSRPGLLVSYFYLKQFEKNKHRYCYRDWVMDSGAFSAHNSGVEIKLQDYIDCCKRLMVSDPTLTEIYALDVIGDWEASLANVEEMWRQGVPAIPCFHYGEPWELLELLCLQYPKIALGGCVGKRDKNKYAEQVFARAWPKKIHGFGFGHEESILALPYHSTDATNWEMGPCAFGRWASFGGATISVRGSNQNLRAEVEYYLDLEQRAGVKWKKQMAQLETIAPTIRLCMIPKQGTEKDLNARAFPVPSADIVHPTDTAAPAVRLVTGCGRSTNPDTIANTLGFKAKEGD